MHPSLLSQISCRQNIEAGYLPMPTDMTFEGLVKEYYFNTQG